MKTEHNVYDLKMKFGFFQKKTGTVKEKDVYLSKELFKNTDEDQLRGKYSGEIKDGLCHGKGTLILTAGFEKDDLTYEGGFYEGKYHGKGILIEQRNADFYKYEGEFKNGLFHGKGIKFEQNGTFFEGTFEENVRIKGKQVFREGNHIKEYEGQYGEHHANLGIPNAPGGTGKITYSNGDFYEGGILYKGYKIMKDLLDEIFSKMTYANGVTFEGYFKEDEKSSGKQQWPDGSYYEGKWANEARSGKGVMVYTDGSKYEGDWKNDKKDGTGSMIYAEGSKYEGGWKEDKRHGLGTLLDKDGFIIHKGEWLDDDFVDDGNQNKISLD